jgi:hypothetical protein
MTMPLRAVPSTSVTLPASWLEMTKVVAVSSSVVRALAGVTMTGASLTGVTVIATVSVSLAMPSLLTIVSVSLPLKLALGL